MNFPQQFRQLASVLALLVIAGCASTPQTPVSVKSTSQEAALLVGSANAGDTVPLPQSNSLGLRSVVAGRIYSAASGKQCRRMLDVNGVPLARVTCKNDDGTWRFARDLRASSLSQPVPMSNVATANPVQTSTIVEVATLDDQVIESADDASIVPVNDRLLEQPANMNATELAVPVDESLPNNNVIVLASAKANEIRVVTPQTDAVSLPTATSMAASFATTLAKHTESIDSMSTDVIHRELHANETLWSFAKRTTGRALNWKIIAETNGISETHTMAPGTELAIPAELVGNGG